MKTKVKALKKLYFSNNIIIQPSKYVEVDDELLQKFLKWGAIEVIDDTKSISYSENKKSEGENAESKNEEKEKPDIIEVVEKIDVIKNKSELILYGNSLGIDDLTMEMTKEEIKAAIVNGMENNNEI